MKTTVLALILASAFAGLPAAHADEDGAYLDPAYKVHHHPLDLPSLLPFGRFPEPEAALPARSDVAGLIARQSAVKSQAQRGTCSIFSSTAMLESMLIIKHHAPASIDLSEEWLEYVVARTHSDDGSVSSSNFQAFANYGDTAEGNLPYIGETWDSVDYSDLSRQRCGSVPANLQKGCLLAHRDPRLLTTTDAWLQANDAQFLHARTTAYQMRDNELTSLRGQTSFWLGTTDEVKQLLAAGIPVTLDLDFYYGAWNHRKETDLGLERDMDHWYKGIIGYPEVGSIDRRDSRDASKIEPAGHSILVVGYDDNVEVATRQKMEDGSEKEFTYKGVFYFKNSWGTDSFGSQMMIDGVNFPGYGMITQKYATEFGTFYKLPLQ